MKERETERVMTGEEVSLERRTKMWGVVYKTANDVENINVYLIHD